MSSPLRIPITLNALRIGLAWAGFVVAFVSVIVDNRRIAWGAMALLIGSLICRILVRKRENSSSGSVHDCDGNHR